MTINLLLNGQPRTLPEDSPVLLLDALHDAGCPGTHGACREGDCGSCQVLVATGEPNQPPCWRALPSCLIRTRDMEGHALMTIEGLTPPARPGQALGLSPVQQALADAGASQCGYCSPGLVVAVINWLLHGPHLTQDEGEDWINGNLCRCTGYMGQRRALADLPARLELHGTAPAERLSRLVAAGVLPPWASQPVTRSPAPTATPPNAGPLLGGGTDLYLSDRLPNLSGSSLLTPHATPIRHTAQGTLCLNARVPVQRIADALDSQGLLPEFARFNHLFAARHVRERATLGGNLAHASPIGDGITLLLALDASLITHRRTLPLRQMYTGFKQTCLEPGEIIEWIELPAGATQDILLFDKVSRRETTDIAVVNMASVWRLHQDRVVQVRCVVGGATPVPVRLTDLDATLAGLRLGDPLPATVPACMQPALAPISDLRGSARYRRLLAHQLLQHQWQRLQAQAQVTKGEPA